MSRRFPALKISGEDQRQYDAVAASLLQHTLNEYERYRGALSRSEWAAVRSNGSMNIFRNLRMAEQSDKVVLMMGSGRLPGSLEDVMDGIYSDSTEELLSSLTLAKHKFVEGHVFHVSERRSTEKPFRFAGVKWVASKGSWGGMAKHQDLLTYERMGITRDAKGNELAYHVQQSIDRQEWPANLRKQYKRGRTSTCYLFRRDHNTVKCFLWGEVYGSKSMRQQMANYNLAGQWLTVTRSFECAEAKRFSRLIRESNARIVTLSTVCCICRERRSLLGGHKSCAGCRKDVCKPCSAMRTVFEMDARTGKPLTKRFCKDCIIKVSTRNVSDELPEEDEMQMEMHPQHQLKKTTSNPIKNAMAMSSNSTCRTESSAASNRHSAGMISLDDLGLDDMGPTPADFYEPEHDDHLRRDSEFSSSKFTSLVANDKTVPDEVPDFGASAFSMSGLRNFDLGLNLDEDDEIESDAEEPSAHAKRSHQPNFSSTIRELHDEDYDYTVPVPISPTYESDEYSGPSRRYQKAPTSSSRAPVPVVAYGSTRQLYPERAYGARKTSDAFSISHDELD